MAKFELKLPKMGESVAEATVTNWLKNVGDTIELDEPVLEIATDKVDSEVPSEVAGVLVEQLFQVDDVVQVGQTLAIIETEGEVSSSIETPSEASESKPTPETVAKVEATITAAKEATEPVVKSSGDRFYSPLVRNMATTEGISQDELDAIPGSGKDGRLTKNDMLSYLNSRSSSKEASQQVSPKVPTSTSPVQKAVNKAPLSVYGGYEFIEMNRLVKVISHHMS